MKFQSILTDANGNVLSIPEFSGMMDGYLSLERHKDFHTVQEFFNSTLQAFGKNVSLNGGREYLKNTENALGPDAIITIVVNWDVKNTGTFELMYSGIIAVGLFIETLEDDHLLQFTISQTDWWQKFIKRFDSQVNVQSNGDVEGNIVTPANFRPITLTTQKINKSYIAYRSKNAVIPVSEITNPVFIIGFDQEDLKEITEQSNLGTSVITGGNTNIYPEDGTVVPFWNLTDSGNLVIENILLTMSFGSTSGDPNYTPSADFINAKNNKCYAMVSFDLFIQKNSEEPVKFNKTHRNVPTSFLRNDGVLEQLSFGHPGFAQVTDFTLSPGYSLKITKYDAVKIYMLDNTIVAPPVTDADGMIFVWGQNGWDHNSGFDQLRNAQGGYMRKTGTSSHQPSNKGNVSYGGIFNAANNVFPDHIDNEAGLNQNIQIGNWYNIGDAPGVLGGATVTSINVLTALANMVAGSAACQNPANWNIGVLTPYEGLENYAIASTTFQGYYDPSSGNFPATEKDGITLPKKYDRWFITSLMTNLQGAYVDSTYIIQSLINNPGNVRGNWWISTRDFYTSYYLDDLQLQGNWDASVNVYPSLEADGASAILQDDIWIISTGGSFGGVGGVPVDQGYVIRARVNAPRQVNANWDVFTLEEWQAYVKANLKIFNGITATFETTYPDTVAQGFLLHDVGAALCDRITGLKGLFYSPLLGNPFTQKVFASIGDFSLFALFKGLQIRGYDLLEKPFFMSMKEFWEGINNIACLAIGRYKVAGNDQIVIKTRAEVYNPTIIVKLNWVQNIKRSYIEDEQYTSIGIGFTTWESKSGGSGEGIASGIDDIQTQQYRNTLFKNIGKKITIFSDLITAALSIEATRRVTNKQSANYQYDNNNHLIALDATCSKPELSENFSEVDGLLNSDTRYNIRLSTFRSFLRHLDYLSGCLQKNLTSFFRFGGGKGNYRAATKATSNYLGDNPGVLITENQDINPSNNPLYVDKVYDIEHFLDWDCYKLLRDNPDMAIGVSQTDTDHVPFFIEDLQWHYGNGKLVLKAKPKTAFDIKTLVAGGGTRFYEPAYEPDYE